MPLHTEANPANPAEPVVPRAAEAADAVDAVGHHLGAPDPHFAAVTP